MDKFIQVIFSDGARGKMAPSALEVCLRHNRIRSFHRASGWVAVGLDRIRGAGRANGYYGPERRA